ncbi:hypothetical protein O6H91_11G075500 [Diphasiastrum complanatum]|uniref:Uncharacterized protein n=1 Tax=Diphasiastrum complanatum TaxID=34168 RepID=A0ACC2CAP6_DIPCM|nr:hypothetical protein O6H91_11G075500 [Diphasiastrum complanatum]
MTNMTALVARTGREQQRYEHGYRLVAGCIPYRYKEEVYTHNPEQTLEVLMVTSQRGKGRLFPKGGWETDETLEEAACREALEEAGVRGQLKMQAYLGSWEFKSKRQQGLSSPEGLCRAHMFALAVTEQLDSWPEQQSRRRQWFSAAEAIEHCCHEWMRRALIKFLANLASSSSSPSLALSSSEDSSNQVDEDQSA